MAKQRYLGKRLDIVKSFSSEDGKHYRGLHQQEAPVIKRAATLREMNDTTSLTNPNGWRSEGVIPMAVLVDWLGKHGYTMDEFARNDGGSPRVTVHNYHKDGGVKAKFLKYFLSRDFSQLHSHHVTTKTESRQIFTGD